MIYAIGDMITDPDSGEELERLEIVKGIGRVVHLQGKISTVESDVVEETPRHIKRSTSLGGVGICFWAVMSLRSAILFGYIGDRGHPPIQSAEVRDRLHIEKMMT